MVSKRPSEFVGGQVRALRGKREWDQEDLVARLEELGIPGWRQSKVAKIEGRRVKRLALDDVYELALALDVAPIYLLAPSPQYEDKPASSADAADARVPVRVRLAPKITYWPHEVRQWVDGTRPLPRHHLRYKNDEAARRGLEFFYFFGRPMGEWQLDSPEAQELVREAQVQPGEEEAVS